MDLISLLFLVVMVDTDDTTTDDGQRKGYGIGEKSYQKSLKGIVFGYNERENLDKKTQCLKTLSQNRRKIKITFLFITDIM